MRAYLQDYYLQEHNVLLNNLINNIYAITPRNSSVVSGQLIWFCTPASMPSLFPSNRKMVYIRKSLTLAHAATSAWKVSFFYLFSPFQPSPLCPFCYPFRGWLSASSNKHRWLKRAVGQLHRLESERNYITNQAALPMPVGCEHRQPRDRIHDICQPSSMTEQRPPWPKKPQRPNGNLPGAPN